MSDNNGKTLRAKADDSLETVWALVASKWWDRTDGGRKKNRFITIPVHLDDGSILVGKYTEPDGVGTITLLKECHTAALPSAEKPAFE